MHNIFVVTASKLNYNRISCVHVHECCIALASAAYEGIGFRIVLRLLGRVTAFLLHRRGQLHRVRLATYNWVATHLKCDGFDRDKGWEREQQKNSIYIFLISYIYMAHRWYCVKSVHLRTRPERYCPRCVYNFDWSCFGRWLLNWGPLAARNKLTDRLYKCLLSVDLNNNNNILIITII